jgi:glycosyltransferase involved in cell wall biosynthesis
MARTYEYVYLVGGNIAGCNGFIRLAKLAGTRVVFRSSLAGYDDIGSLVGTRGKSRISRSSVRRIHTYLSINPLFTKSANQSGAAIGRMVESSQGVNTAIFRPCSPDEKIKLRKKHSVPLDSFAVLSVGHIIRRKGYDEIIDFLSGINTGFLYMVAGETGYWKGHFMSGYETETAELVEKAKSELGEKVRFTGPLQDLREWYCLADLFVLGSRTEGTPNVLLEAMACGLPLLCRKIDGIEGYLLYNGKNGFTYQDESSFLEAFYELSSNPEKRKEFGNTSRKIIEQGHSFQDLYDKVFTG